MDTIKVKKSSSEYWIELIEIEDVTNVFLQGKRMVDGSQVDYYFGQFMINERDVYTVIFSNEWNKSEITLRTSDKYDQGNASRVADFIEKLHMYKYKEIGRSTFKKLYETHIYKHHHHLL